MPKAQSLLIPCLSPLDLATLRTRSSSSKKKQDSIYVLKNKKRHCVAVVHAQEILNETERI